MALGDPYATADDLKARMGIEDTIDDATIDDALDAASRSIEGYCNRQFNVASSATARVYYPDSEYLCTVDDFSTTSGFVLQTDYGFDGVYESTWDSTQYSLEPLNGIVDGQPNWPYWKVRAVRVKWFPIWIPQATVYPSPSVQITAVWGWPSVPSNVRQATLLLAGELLRMKDAPFGVVSFGELGAMRVRDNPKVESLLRRYRRSAPLVG